MTAADDLHATALAVAGVPRAAMIEAAKAVKKIAAVEGKPSTMKGHKKRAITLGTSTSEKAAGPDAARVIVFGVPSGPWVWITDGTAPHKIRRRKKGPKSKLSVPHPGTRGNGAWHRVEKRAADEIPKIFTDAVVKAVNRRG